MLPTVAFADQVTLKSADGTVNLVGEFVEFADDNYIIRTALGDLRISASRVRCEGDACPKFETATADVQISGSETIGLGLMPLLMNGYASSLDASADITNTPLAGQFLTKLVGDGGFGDDIGSYLVTSSSSEEAFNGLLSGDAKIGMASRRILPAEAKKLRAAGAGNMVSPTQERVIAVDSLVVITHPSNPVGEISIENLRNIYAGRIRNWAELGGPDAAINVYDHQANSSSRDVFQGRVFEGSQASISGGHSEVGDDQEMAAKVNDDPAGIGYVGFAFQRGAKPLTLVNDCGIASKPDAFSAKTEEYALQRRMYLYNRSDNLDEATSKFLDFAVSEGADGVVAKSGFIDLGITKRSQDLTGSRANDLINAAADAFESGIMRNMLAEMLKADRLSTTFRFRPGSSTMDEKALIDMQRLISYLERQPEGTEVSLVGFTDDVGPFEANLRLSEQRAAQVSQDLMAASGGRLDNIVLKASGFGEIAPSSCNVTDTGRGINRRVEVWLGKKDG